MSIPIKHPVDWVNPLIDTANRRFFFFSSACRPFGLVNLSPDTVQGGAWEAGYRYTEETVCWFSHIHAWQLSALPVLPTTGLFQGHLGADNYKSAFSHDQEIVQPGYHALTLSDYNIHAELTATDRVGFHRYTFPESETSHILFDLTAEIGPSLISNCIIEQVSDTELVGFVENDATRRRPKPTRIYFTIVFDRPTEAFGGWQNGQVQENINGIRGPNTGAFVRFKTVSDDVLQMKVALSYCNVEGACLNLQTELPHWDFDRVREEAREVWNQWLSRIEVEGGTEARTTKFYTDLYHAILGRRRVSDVDGKYCDQTGPEPVVRQIPLDTNGKPQYESHNSDAFWGVQWTLNVLWSLAYPDIVHNFCNTFLDYYQNGGLIPRGPSGGNYTFVMTSATSTPLFVSAYQKNIRSFDIDLAYEGLVKNHGPGGLMSKAGYEHDTCIGGGIEYYIDRGYVPLGIKAHAFHCDGPAQTLEYAFQDWCLAQLALALGKEEDCDRFTQRASNYKNIYDSKSGFMCPKTLDGAWLEPFDPSARDGWNEGNGWHYLWWVPHDVKGLIDLMGGRETFIQRLNEQFERASEKNLIAPRGKHEENVIEYGNQPCTHLAHLFTYAGAPYLTQKWVRAVMDQAKSDITPYGGYGGDEDQGQMGALNALMAIGLFQMRGGCEADPVYEITTPLFERVTLHLDPDNPDKTFIIEVHNNPEQNVYTQSAELNNQPLNRAWFRHSDLAEGATLKLHIGPEPNREWGIGETPPSMSDEQTSFRN